jgi:antitoxin YefM
MITAIREKVLVKEGGRIEILSSEFKIGKEVEVIILADDEVDATEYLLSTDANREHLFDAIDESRNRENLIYVDVDNL